MLHKEGLRAEVVDVRAFLGAHFQVERAQQEELIKKVRKGPLASAEGPLFELAEHGLDSGEREAARDLGYSDGDTEREVGIPAGMIDGILPAEQELPHDTMRDKPHPTAGPASKSSGVWKLIALVALLVFVAAMIGLVAGRHAGPR